MPLLPKKIKLLSFGASLQPTPIIIEKKTSFECYVYVDNQFYPVSTPLRAVDITFKIIHILNALYPTEAEQIWLLLHKAVYKLDTAWDKQFTCVMSLLSYYKGLLL